MTSESQLRNNCAGSHSEVPVSRSKHTHCSVTVVVVFCFVIGFACRRMATAATAEGRTEPAAAAKPESSAEGPGGGAARSSGRVHEHRVFCFSI